MSQFKYFKLEDFNCQETGENEMCIDFIHRLDELREACGFPFIITSGYRSPNHSIEKRKEKVGTHAKGIASDIKVTNRKQKYKIVKEAIKMGFGGIGIANTFIHVDNRSLDSNGTGVIWSY